MTFVRGLPLPPHLVGGESFVFIKKMYCTAYYLCHHTTECVSSYYYICVLILLYMCPQAEVLPVLGGAVEFFLQYLTPAGRLRPHTLVA